MHIRIRRRECCGNGECVEIAPNVFAMDSKQKVVVVDSNGASDATMLEAAEACPCSAIVLVDDEGNDITA
jgi:ferredoxin